MSTLLCHTARPALRMIGYSRTSTDDRFADFDAQEAVIRVAAAERPEWQLVAVEREETSSNDDAQPVLVEVLDRIRQGDADGLVVARIDRLTSSLSHLGVLLADMYARHWVLVALDVMMDASVTSDEMNTDAVALSTRVRRQLISRNIREALAVKREQGVRLGRPRRCPDHVLTRVVAYRALGARLVDICKQLNADGVLTPAGSARWYPSHVSRLLRTQDAIQSANSQRLRLAG